MYSRNESDKLLAGGYLDGVPVKIGEKFKPPRRITLPLNYVHRNADEVLSENYDFSLERQVLEWAEKKRREKQDAERAKVEKVASQIEKFTQMTSTSSETKSKRTDDSNIPSFGGFNNAQGSLEHVNDAAKISSALLANLEGQNILKPTFPQPIKSVPSNVTHSNYRTSNIKLEDFEAESSPFDNMELKTLNDMEELKSVLQSITPSSQANVNTNNLTEIHSSSDPENKTQINGTIQYYPGGSHINGIVTCSQTPNISVPRIYDTVPQHNYGMPFNQSYNMISQSLPANSIMFQSMPTSSHQSLSSGNGQNFTSFIASSNPSTWNMNYDSQAVPFYTQANPKLDYAVSTTAPNCSIPSAAYYSPESQSPDYKCNGYISIADSNGAVSYLRNSRSTPDLLKELGKSYKEESSEKKRHSHTQHGRPNSTADIENMSSVGYGIRDQSASVLENPFSKLNDEDRSLVLQIMDMGFPQARVARAVKQFGHDDKKVIEHLCTIQSLQEKGFDSDRAETALNLHNQEEAMTIKYLELLKQFKDLGFPEESITKALLLHKNDRDKALDYLLT